ncbi:MAG: hypothetical protein AAB373_02075 [Patescibacteria group bacterium]
MFKNIYKNQRGSALLVALLVMGVLISISLALSSLIFRETRITREFLDAGQAYYSAESGIELALYSLNSKLPGWELSKYMPFEVDGESDTVGEIKVENRCPAYPCFDEDEFDKSTASPKEFYEVLDLNQAITIPLFVVENGKDVPVRDFTVEYFAAFNPSTDLKVKPTKGELSGWDVLRWKVFGIENLSGGQHSETISDFTAVSMLNNAGGDQFTSNATKPSWFGTRSCSDYKNRYTGEIDCAPFLAENGKKNIIELDPEGLDVDQLAKIFAGGSCGPTFAREYYEYEYFGDERDVLSIKDCYSISDFLDPGKHTLNYLTLTNLINPSVFKDGLEKDDLSKLYFRVELFAEDGQPAATAREFADLTANGYSGDSKQSINVKIRRDSFMPVFNFSLYSTYMSNKKESDGKVHNDEYWYGAEKSAPGGI